MNEINMFDVSNALTAELLTNWRPVKCFGGGNHKNNQIFTWSSNTIKYWTEWLIFLSLNLLTR